MTAVDAPPAYCAVCRAAGERYVPLAVDESRTRCAHHARTMPVTRPVAASGSTRPRNRRPGGRRMYRELSPVGQWHARTYARRPGRNGPFLVPRLADVALPPGYEAVVDRREGLALFHLLPGTAALRSDAWSTRWAIWRALCDFLHEDGLAVVGQERLGLRAAHYAGRPVPRTTVGNHLRVLEADGAVYVAERGASMQILGADRHRAPVYAVLVPRVLVPALRGVQRLPEEYQAVVDELGARLEAAAGGLSAGEMVSAVRCVSTVDENGHPPNGSAALLHPEESHSRKSRDFPSSAHIVSSPEPESERLTAPIHRQERPALHPLGILGRLQEVVPATFDRSEHPELFVAKTNLHRSKVAGWLVSVMGWPWQMRSEEEVRKIISPFLAAGWVGLAVLHAWHYQPNGEPWPALPEPRHRDRRDAIRVRNLWAVLTWRMQAWRDPMGHPVAPPIEACKLRRGRPAGEAAMRRQLLELHDRLPVGDQRRARLAAAITALGGGRPRSAPERKEKPAAVQAELAALRAKLAAQAADRAAEKAARDLRHLRAERESLVRYQAAVFRARIERDVP